MDVLPKATGYVTREGKLVEAEKVHHSMPFSAGAMASTAKDLLKWNKAVFSYGLLPKELMDEAWEPARLNNGQEVNYGFGWSLGRLDDLKVIYHGGATGGFVSYVLNIPSEKLFIAILTNKDDFGLIDISERIARIVLNKPITNPEPIKIANPILEDYTGTYKSEQNYHRVIRRENNKLISTDSYGNIAELLCYEKDKFFINNLDIRLEFERNSNNVISGIKVLDSEWIPNREERVDSSVFTLKSPIALKRSVFEPYIGTYEISPDFKIKIWRDIDRYMVTSTLHGDFEMHAESETRFFIPGANVAIEFLSDDDLSVSAINLTANGTTSKGKRVK
jgi:hypothetical protein